MSYLESIKHIRELRNIQQKDMLPGVLSHSGYSKIENGKSTLKLDTLQEIIDRLNISLEELSLYAENNNLINNFIKIFNSAITDPENEMIITKLLNHPLYKVNKDIKTMSQKEVIAYAAIKNIMSGLTKNKVTPLNNYEKEYIVEYITSTNFYGQYDYLLILNTITCLTEEQSNIIIRHMFPVTDTKNRTAKTLNYAFLVLSNVITIAIYNLDYKKAIDYISLAETMIDTSTSYHSRMILEYHKNIALRFLKKDTIYIEKARQIIQITRFIGDEKTARSFETELNNLTTKADYYLETHKYPTILVNK
ncbi:helix-turn-helix domain-containing protein [Candidatus Enterococcus mansonii]|uniref:HTH cro/C1-type domain-containing protein n=1 Tax=Candidatus Enterococcus mansonii TaxID=1834181 RepID=A0A242BUV1_9ENTE|nr:hypothetical protein A5880_003196 [Enterococcus sp. 4G2_DIV0659]